MAESCLLTKYFPGFQTKSPCSLNFIGLNSIPRERLAIYISNLGYILSDFEKNCHDIDNAVICNNHFQELRNLNYNKLRTVKCMVPPNLATHTFPKKHERRLTEDNVQQIHASTGNVLPIGAGICNSCRVHLIVNKRPSLQIQDSKKVLCKTESNENGVQLQVDMNDDYMCKPMERARKSRKMPITKDESDMMNDDHTPLKRSRRSVTKVSSCTVQSSDGCGEFDSEDLSQETVVSEASVSNSSKLEALNHYLALSNVSPIKECQVYLQHSSNRTKQRYINKAKQCLDLILTTICPGEEEFLRRSVLNDIQLDSVEEENAILETLVEIYNGANSWAFQRQILSTIVKDKDFSAVKELLPTVTRYKFNQAKEHIQEHGVGEPISKRKVPREKYTHSQLDHFIDFITSGDIIKDQPFGEKTLKMETGEVLKIPTVIRCLAPSTIISRYTDVCKEDNIKPLGNSTLFKILEECSAVFRKSIEGLDNFLMEGIKAFEELDKIVKRLELSTEDEKPLTAGLQSAKNYLKSGFKGHITKENMVEDHCISYALSSSEPFFAAECEHQHGDTCTDCQNLDIVLSSIQQKAEEHQWQNQEAAMYTVEEAVEAIKKWKCHILRCRNQERARSDIVQQMSEDDAIITCDWAMKFLPKKYREGQVDWFAKRGMNWHIAVTLLKDGQNFSTLTHVHIFDCPISQDAPITSQILTDVARDILKEKPAVKNINFFTDNAGCYKSSTTILTLQKELKNTVSSFNFCEAQNGKGPCDRRASHIKSIIRRYINEGNDVTSAFHMKKAVDNEQKPDLKLKVVSSVNIVDDDQHELEPRYSIPGISKLYNFLYSQDGLRMWKAYAIGEGKLMKWRSLGCPSPTVELKTLIDWGHAESRVLITEIKQDEEAESLEHITGFHCPVENCTKQFSTQRAVDDHVLMGTCSFATKERLCVTEKAKYIYAEKIMKMYPTNKEPGLLPVTSVKDIKVRLPSLPSGWALKETKGRVVFTNQQKEFMKEKFNIGKTTGNKVDPFCAAEEMRLSGKFKRADFLSGQQISSYFSRLVQLDKKTSKEDYWAAVCEENQDLLKCKIQQVLK